MSASGCSSRVRRRHSRCRALRVGDGIGPCRDYSDRRPRRSPDPHRVLRPNQVYELFGFVGFHLDLEFAPDERFVGLSAGDPKALTYSAHGNILTLRPKVAHDAMNLTVTTTAHRYYFDYTIAPRPDRDDVRCDVRGAIHLSAAAL